MENSKENNTASTHKTKIEQATIEAFLQSHYKSPVTDIVAISGGEGSQAFSFNVNNEAFILRVNKHLNTGFKKDEYAFRHFNSQEIPIPEVTEIGTVNSGEYFAISKKVDGTLFKHLSDREFDEALPNLFITLDSIHAIDVSDKEGYGKWDEDGKSDKESWKSFLLNVDEYAVHMFGNSMLEKEVWDKAYVQFVELLPFCPEEKYLIHGDYNFDNILSKDGKISGVIDWEGSMYGDFLYDVARLQFFAKDFDYEKAYFDFHKDKEKNLKNLNERLLCYKLYIGLGALSFYAYSKQKDKYDLTKEKLFKLQGADK